MATNQPRGASLTVAQKNIGDAVVVATHEVVRVSREYHPAAIGTDQGRGTDTRRSRLGDGRRGMQQINCCRLNAQSDGERQYGPEPAIKV